MLSWYFASSGIEYYFRKNLLLANCLMELKKKSFYIEAMIEVEGDQVKKIKITKED